MYIVLKSFWIIWVVDMLLVQPSLTTIGMVSYIDSWQPQYNFLPVLSPWFVYECLLYSLSLITVRPGPWFNIKMSSYQYRKSNCGDKTVVRSSYLHNGISYTGKMSSLYWIGAQDNMDVALLTTVSNSFLLWKFFFLVMLFYCTNGQPFANCYGRRL